MFVVLFLTAWAAPSITCGNDNRLVIQDRGGRYVDTRDWCDRASEYTVFRASDPSGRTCFGTLTEGSSVATGTAHLSLDAAVVCAGENGLGTEAYRNLDRAKYSFNDVLPEYGGSPDSVPTLSGDMRGKRGQLYVNGDHWRWWEDAPPRLVVEGEVAHIEYRWRSRELGPAEGISMIGVYRSDRGHELFLRFAGEPARIEWRTYAPKTPVESRVRRVRSGAEIVLDGDVIEIDGASWDGSEPPMQWSDGPGITLLGFEYLFEAASFEAPELLGHVRYPDAPTCAAVCDHPNRRNRVSLWCANGPVLQEEQVFWMRQGCSARVERGRLVVDGVLALPPR